MNLDFDAKNPNNLTYQYKVGLTLNPILMTNADGSHLACNTTNKSDTNGTSALTYFDGWYEYYDAGTGQYSSKLEAIPSNY